MVALYAVLAARLAAGLNSAVTPTDVALPDTAAPPGPVSVKVAAVMLAGSIASLKVAAKPVLIATPVAPFGGLVELSVGPEAGAPPPLLPQPAMAAAKKSVVKPKRCLEV